MSDQKNNSVSITIGTNMYGRFEDLPNSISHDLAEFIDNALQSFRDNKEKLLESCPNYRLKVSIDFEWSESDKRATKITITDNAAGISEKKFATAFMPAETPENNEGLNEFGMGMKTAALWLGHTWRVRSKAIGETVERSLLFNLDNVVLKELKELPVILSNKGIDEHYTIVQISDSTKNVPTQKSLEKIKAELASIYRKSLRENEMQIIVSGEKLVFEEYPILFAPPAKALSKKPVLWKKDIDFKFQKYKAKGFIGILRDINSTQNGFVLLRRGRVIIGAETDGRYFPKCLSGSTGTFRYKRIFGELELDGFEVSFNKNDIQDKENLESLMEAIKGEIHTKEFDLYNQAEEYRLDEIKKQVNQIVKKHNKSPKDTRSAISISTKGKTSSQGESPTVSTAIVSQPPQNSLPTVIGEYDDNYSINGINVTLKVQFVDSGYDLFWVDVSQKKDNIVICQVNTSHVFFQYFGKPTNSIIAILKTLVISKYSSKTFGNDSTAELFNYFNEYIKNTKV